MPLISATSRIATTIASASGESDSGGGATPPNPYAISKQPGGRPVDVPAAIRDGTGAKHAQPGREPRIACMGDLGQGTPCDAESGITASGLAPHPSRGVKFISLRTGCKPVQPRVLRNAWWVRVLSDMALEWPVRRAWPMGSGRSPRQDCGLFYWDTISARVFWRTSLCASW